MDLEALTFDLQELLRTGVGISENFPGTRYPPVPKNFFWPVPSTYWYPKNFFLAGTRYSAVAKFLKFRWVLGHRYNL